MKFTSIIKFVCAVSLLAGLSTAAPLETTETDDQLAPITPTAEAPAVPSAAPELEQEDKEDDDSNVVGIPSSEDVVPIYIVAETESDKPLHAAATPSTAGQNTTLLLLASTEEFAKARSMAVSAFKDTWDPLTRVITADFLGLNGPRTFFKADKHHFFVLQDETAALVSQEPPYVDYNAYDLQTGELVTLRTRQKYQVNGSDLYNEAMCNNIMKTLVHDYFKSSNIVGTNWVVLRSAAAAPTVRQVLERGRGNAPEHLLPFELYKTAAAELSRLHKRYRYHGYVRLSNFKVDEVTGAVTLTNFMFCRSLYPGTLYELSFKILAEEKRKLLNLFSAYMTADEITKVEL